MDFFSYLGKLLLAAFWNPNNWILSSIAWIAFLYATFVWFVPKMKILMEKVLRPRLYRYRFFLLVILIFSSLVTSAYTMQHNVQLELIVPKLQVKPFDIIESIQVTTMKIDILNYSDYTAKNIFVDIKFGDNLWKRELTIAEHRDSILNFEIEDQQLKELLENFYNRPVWGELKPRKRIKLYLADENKDFLSTLDVYFTGSDGKTVPISPEETSSYRRSQGWKEEIESMDSGESIKILLRAVWENEIGRKFDQIIEYQLICTIVGTGRSYTFLPTGIVIEDF